MSKLRFGIVGLGNMGMKHLRVLSEHPDAEVVAVAEPVGRSPKMTTAGLNWYRHSGEMFEAEKLDAVVIAAPTIEHAELSWNALNAGYHVLVEKPMTASYTAALDLLLYAKSKQDQVFMVGYIERYNPVIRSLAAALEAWGVRPIYYEARRSGLPNFKPDRGSVVDDLASHDVNLINAFVHQGFLRVSGATTAGDKGGIQDACAATLVYADGTIGSISADRLSPDKVRELRVLCVEGTFTADLIGQKLVWHAVGFSPEEVAVEEVGTNEPLALELDHFIACIETGQAPLTSATDALATAAITQRIKEAGSR